MDFGLLAWTLDSHPAVGLGRPLRGEMTNYVHLLPGSSQISARGAVAQCLSSRHKSICSHEPLGTGWPEPGGHWAWAVTRVCGASGGGPLGTEPPGGLLAGMMGDFRNSHKHLSSLKCVMVPGLPALARRLYVGRPELQRSFQSVGDSWTVSVCLLYSPTSSWGATSSRKPSVLYLSLLPYHHWATHWLRGRHVSGNVGGLCLQGDEG